MGFKVYRNTIINANWYNIESDNGGAISFSLHSGQRTGGIPAKAFEDAIKRDYNTEIKNGQSCPIAWVNIPEVENSLRSSEFDELKDVIDYVSSIAGRHNIYLACPCNSQSEKDD